MNDVEEFMTDPLAFFDSSVTKMHSIEPSELAVLQQQAMQKRVADHIENISICLLYTSPSPRD